MCFFSSVFVHGSQQILWLLFFSFVPSRLLLSQFMYKVTKFICLTGAASNCRHTIVPLSQPVIECTPSESCNIFCDEPYSCNGSIFQLNATNVTLVCSGHKSCHGARIRVFNVSNLLLQFIGHHSFQSAVLTMDSNTNPFLKTECGNQSGIVITLHSVAVAPH